MLNIYNNRRVKKPQGGDKMAISTVKEKIALRLQLDGGIVDGKQKLNSKTFAQIKVTAEDENLFAVAETLAGLQEKPLMTVQKVETTHIFNE